MRRYAILAAALLLVVGAGCAPAGKPAPAPSAATPQPIPEPARTSNIFDPFSQGPGDDVGGLTVSSVGPIAGIDRPLAMDNVDALFDGTVDLTGTYSYFISEIDGEEHVCFTPETSELYKLPVLKGVPGQNETFCFDDVARAAEAFGPEHGTGIAEVMISDYELRYAPAEVSNGAVLTEVVSVISGSAAE